MDKEIAVGESAVPVEEDGPVEQADEDRHDEGLAGEGPAQQNQPAHQEECQHALQRKSHLCILCLRIVRP
jgi:hypothetical protein